MRTSTKNVLTQSISLFYKNIDISSKKLLNQWRRGVVVIITAQLHSTKPELKFCAGSNPARGVSDIRDGEDL